MTAQPARQISWDELPAEAAAPRRFLFAVPPRQRNDEALTLRSHWEYDRAAGRLIQMWRRQP